MISALLDELPQEAATSITPFGEIGGELFVACRPMPEADYNPLSSLTAREYQVLTLLAQSMTYTAIKEAAGISANTVGHHLTSIYEKLGVDDGSQAACYVPMNAERLRRTAFYQQWVMGEARPALSLNQASVIELLGKGLSYKQIAFRQRRSRRAVSNNVIAIRNKFEITQPTDRTYIGMRRLIGASTTLAAYDETVMAA
ncbi:MAG TPA: LuxR C-terminal-related transcriptional regulator [Candidatus Saccharimonadales bacterium]